MNLQGSGSFPTRAKPQPASSPTLCRHSETFAPGRFPTHSAYGMVLSPGRGWGGWGGDSRGECSQDRRRRCPEGPSRGRTLETSFSSKGEAHFLLSLNLQSPELQAPPRHPGPRTRFAVSGRTGVQAAAGGGAAGPRSRAKGGHRGYRSAAP